MKRLWVAAAILLVVAAGCIGGLLWQISLLDDLQEQLDAAEQAVRENGVAALDQVGAFEQACFEVTEKLTAVSRHEDNFALKESAGQLYPLLEQEEIPHFFAEAARCRFYIEELRRAEKPLIGNIF